MILFEKENLLMTETFKKGKKSSKSYFIVGKSKPPTAQSKRIYRLTR